jgi:hypothetical protein
LGWSWLSCGCLSLRECCEDRNSDEARGDREEQYVVKRPNERVQVFIIDARLAWTTKSVLMWNLSWEMVYLEGDV